jgi:hypothetical protein
MLNPSIADHRLDDPTIRRCIDFSRRWGFGGLVVVNLFAFRASSPRELLAAADPVGAGNRRAISSACRAASCVVVAWGVHGGRWDRGAKVLAMIREEIPLFCLGSTKNSQPRHPLYVRGDAALLPWPRQPSVEPADVCSAIQAK